MSNVNIVDNDVNTIYRRNKKMSRYFVLGLMAGVILDKVVPMLGV